MILDCSKSTTLLELVEIPLEQSFSGTVNETASLDTVGSESAQHPLGVKPSGNAWTDNAPQTAQIYMGNFGRLPDALILVILEFLNCKALVALGSSCRALYAYSTYDSLWRDIAVNDLRTDFEWRGSWRSSLRKLPSAKLANIDCSSLYSDALYRPFLCSQISLEQYVTNIPRRNEIPRLKNMSTQEFNESWVDKPFILTQPVKTWQIYVTFNQEKLLADYGETPFRCEAVDLPLKTYMSYMNSTQDESPLYLFDRGFVEKMDLRLGGKVKPALNAYEVPDPFQEDLFTLLGDQRPDHRWLIIGPSRSGSTFHKDPNATSAWNAVIRGSKYWIMFPNSVLPPGVYMSEDQSEVTSPLSIAEWLLSFHFEARRTSGCIEGVCGEGEVIHVPSSWWHCVLNIEPAIAITQNFVPKAHAGATLRFLRDKAAQASGFRDDVTDAYALFKERLDEAYPELAASVGDRKRKWKEIVREGDDADGDRQGFNFGFGGDVDEEEI